MIAFRHPIPSDSWPVVDHRPQLHIDMAEAVRRARNSALYTGSREYSAIKSWLYRLAKAAAEGVGSGPVPVMYQDKLYLPPSIHPALCTLRGSEPAVVTKVANLPAARRNKGAAKRQAVADFDRFVRQGAGRRMGAMAARELFVQEHRETYTYGTGSGTATLTLSVRSLERWGLLYRKVGADALARDGRGGGKMEGLSADAVSMYWNLRNDPRRFSLRSCYRKVVMAAKNLGWQWFDSAQTCGDWDRRNRNERGLILNQRGDEAYTRNCGAYVEIDPESYSPGQCWVGDDSTLDVWVKLPNGEVIRPVISVWQDWRSRAIVGYRIIRTGSEQSILLGFGDAAREYGLPRNVIVDNGRNYSSYLWQGGRPKRRNYKRAEKFKEHAEGIFRLCDIEPSWCLPYNPNGKARLERWFRTLEDQCCRNFPSYCGGTPNDRPEAHKRLVAKAVEWDQFVATLNKYISVYNAAPHSGDGMDLLTPLQVMSQRTHKKPLPSGMGDLLLMAHHRPVKLGRNGVAIRIAGATVRYGAFAPELSALPIGTLVRVSYDPDNLDTVVVWTMDHRCICRAEQNRRHNRSINSEQLRETMRRRNSAKRIHRKARKTGIEHIIRDPVQQAVAAIGALENDAAGRRKPDPKPPEGGPLLIPLHSPIKVPSKPLRKAVGAECIDDAADMDARLHDFLARDTDATSKASIPSGTEALRRWAEQNA